MPLPRFPAATYLFKTASEVPSIDLIDFDFACWHERCDRLDQVSTRSLDRVGETVLELLRTL